MSRNPSIPATEMRQRAQVDLEHLPAQWLSAHGNTEGAMWVYDAAAELARLRAERDTLSGLLRRMARKVRFYDQIGETIAGQADVRDKQAKAAVREALRLLDDWQTAEELGTVEEWANQIGDTLHPLVTHAS